MYKLYITLLMLIISMFYRPIDASQKRNLSWKFNPDCKEGACEKQNLAYIKSSNAENDVHFLWSTVGSKASLLAFETEPKSPDVKVDWSKLLSKSCEGSFHMPSKINRFIGFTLDDLFLQSYNDSTGLSFIHTDWRSVNWTSGKKDFICDTRSCTIKFTNTTGEQGGITLSTKISVDQIRSDVLPNLLFNPESFLTIITMDQQIANRSDLRSGIKLSIVTAKNASQLTNTTSNDDEYSPGVFQRLELLFGDDEKLKTFMDWRPVAYSSNERTLSTSLALNDSKIEVHGESNETLAIYCFLKSVKRDYVISDYKTLFGNDDEPNYTKSNYSSFSFVVGIGEPPEEYFSLAMILTISLGFGLPICMMALTLIFLIVRGIRRRNADFNRVEEDEIGEF